MYVTFNETHLFAAHIASVSVPKELMHMGGSTHLVTVKMSNGDDHAVRFKTREEAQTAVDAIIGSITA